MRANVALAVAFILLLASVAVVPTGQAAASGPGTPFSSVANQSNLPPGCTSAFTDGCYHMKGELNSLDSPKIDVLLVVPASPYAERDLRAMHQVVEMYDAGIDYIAGREGWSWLADGVEFHVTPMVCDPVNGDCGEFSTYPVVDPEIVIIRGNPLFVPYINLGVILGIGIDPLAPNQMPCAPMAIDNPFDVQEWEALPGFHSHHDGRGGVYKEDCPGIGGNVCFAVNGGTEPIPDFDLWGINVYDLVAHEFGHCLRLGHVGDPGTEFTATAAPLDDIMSYVWDDTRKCVSSLDVETFAVAMSPYLDTNGDGSVTSADRFYYNDDGAAGSPFQVQRPQDHYYASDSGLAADCPQPDLGITPFGAPRDFSPEGGDEPADPVVTITSPAGGATDVTSPVTVAGTVDRAGVVGLTANAGGPYSGSAGSAIAIAGTALGATGTATCAWATTGSGSFADAAACSTTVTYSSATGAPFTLTLTVTDSTGSDSDTATVNLGPAGMRIGTDGAGDREAGCGTGAPTGCNLDFADPAEAGLDIRAAYIQDKGDAIRFTVQVEDASKFFLDPVGHPASGTGHMNALVLSVSFEAVSPTFGLVSGKANIERTTGQATVTGTLSQVTGLLSRTTPNAGPVTVDLDGDRFSVDIPKSAITFFDQVGSLSALDSDSSITVENGNVDSIISYDLNLATVENAAWSPGAEAARASPPSPAELPAVPTAPAASAAQAPAPHRNWVWRFLGALGLVTDDTEAVAADPVASNSCSGSLPLDGLTGQCTLTVPASATEVRLTSEGTYTGSFSAYVQLFDSHGILRANSIDDCEAGATISISVGGGYSCVMTIDDDVDPGQWSATIDWQLGQATNDYTLTLEAFTGTVTSSSSTTTTGPSTDVERVELYEGSTLLGSDDVATSTATPAGAWSIAGVTLATGEHTVTAKWFDAAVPSSGTPLATATTTFTVGSGVDPCDGDNTGPVFSAIVGTATGATTATVTWTTDEAATSVVHYGTTPAYGSTADNGAAMGTSHSVSLTGLSGSTTYQFEVASTDGCGNAAAQAGTAFTTDAGTPTLPYGVDTAVTMTAGVERFFQLEVPADTDMLSVVMSGPACTDEGTPLATCDFDTDLYVRQGSAPTDADYNCRPYQTSNNEACDMANPAAGTWFIRLDPFSGAGDLTLRADLDLPNADGDGVPDVRDEDADGDNVPDDVGSALPDPTALVPDPATLVPDPATVNDRFVALILLPSEPSNTAPVIVGGAPLSIKVKVFAGASYAVASTGTYRLVLQVDCGALQGTVTSTSPGACAGGLDATTMTKTYTFTANRNGATVVVPVADQDALLNGLPVTALHIWVEETNGGRASNYNQPTASVLYEVKEAAAAADAIDGFAWTPVTLVDGRASAPAPDGFVALVVMPSEPSNTAPVLVGGAPLTFKVKVFLGPTFAAKTGGAYRLVLQVDCGAVHDTVTSMSAGACAGGSDTTTLTKAYGFTAHKNGASVVVPTADQDELLNGMPATALHIWVEETAGSRTSNYVQPFASLLYEDSKDVSPVADLVDGSAWTPVVLVDAGAAGLAMADLPALGDIPVAVGGLDAFRDELGLGWLRGVDLA